jgi:hypothetical protein
MPARISAGFPLVGSFKEKRRITSAGMGARISPPSRHARNPATPPLTRNGSNASQPVSSCNGVLMMATHTSV